MGKKSKIGKQRRDRYYYLAKETGYRSRAAFKLIQLERKFRFLQTSRVCIDLCAAPGGWMQVAHENMPVSSIIIGVDLFPIKPIPGCLSIIGDITTDKCCTDLSRELKTWKADLVLNDGSPNVGKNWLIDAYQQSVLTLSALKLATKFLRRGGCFITKVFRSKDYNPLLWVFKQLFKKVHATKPQASRNESAEIFVVCQHYFAPDKLDSKLLDPKHVFAEVDLEPQNKLNIFNPEKQKKAKPLGYPENDYTLYHKLSVKDFIANVSGIDALQNISEIVIDDENILNHKKTTNEVIECCKDIKVLGRRELRLLLQWWKVLKDEFHKEETDNKEKHDLEEENVEEKPKTLEEEEDMEDEQIIKDIQKLKEEKAKELKRKRKKINKEKNKLAKKINLKMVIKGDQGPIMECDDMFSLKQIETIDHLKKIENQCPDLLAESDNDSDDVQTPKIVKYEKGTGHLDSKGLYYKDDESELEFSEDDSSSYKSGLDLSESEEEEKIIAPIPKKVKFVENENPLLTDLDYRDKESKKLTKAKLWFDRDVFKNLENERHDDIEIDKMIEVYKKMGGKILGQNDNDDSEDNKMNKDDISDYKDDNNDSDYNSDYNTEDVMASVTESNNKTKKNKVNVILKDKPKKKKEKRKLTTEGLALGSLLVQSKKSRREITDAGWNRFAFNDENLPDWFVEDESKHMKKETPVPKELVSDYKKRLQDITAKPIKKVMEAKARKKKRALRKIEKAKKKVENVMDNTEISEREKAKQIKSLYRNAVKEPKKDVTYVVTKKYMAQKRVVRPSNVKGRYKVVDPRMKKDMRARKAKEKTKGRGKKTKSSKPSKGKSRTERNGKRKK
ncbi:PREDICTED: pre-rRNA processing protein FTSJ3 [Ceratosolen solmsi marchali]|uniref:Putative rRNA methyltransferase n=1 Tax=Ceratosolen solmsi marchali TaxID=326594 RepID=A0AAJ7DWY0_9HYME|nr:PREDICTED: pre-rRNA processing protein FTSJ3 [Ceratosolen solmsi marchali]